MVTISDPARARRLLEAAIAHTTRPALPTERVDDLLVIATVKDLEGADVFTGRSLNSAAAIGWNWKAALVSDQFDVEAGDGVSATRSQRVKHCLEMAAKYSSGEASVLGDTTTGGEVGGGARGRVGSIGLTTSTAVRHPRDCWSGEDWT